ncbi:MAG: hypothetical protein AAF138_04940 [Planctomycetota bacterium]
MSTTLESTPATPATPSGGASALTGPPGPDSTKPEPEERKTLFEKMEAFVSRLSTRNNFWHRVCSMIWLPYAFRSGIRMKRLDTNTFTAILPFRRFNRNWYNAMAGAALLGNSEIAGGMYVFGVVGGDYTVVCKRLQYRFLRPCFGPAVYRITPEEDLEALVAGKGEFNVTVKLDVLQSLTKPGEREKLVGRSVATFHVTPKAHHKRRKARAKERAEQAALEAAEAAEAGMRSPDDAPAETPEARNP